MNSSVLPNFQNKSLIMDILNKGFLSSTVQKPVTLNLIFSVTYILPASLYNINLNYNYSFLIPASEFLTVDVWLQKYCGISQIKTNKQQQQKSLISSKIHKTSSLIFIRSTILEISSILSTESYYPQILIHSLKHVAVQ